jgi:hypothetical protein
MMPERDPLPFDPSFAGAVDWANMYRALGVQVVPTMIPASKSPANHGSGPLCHGVDPSSKARSSRL